MEEEEEEVTTTSAGRVYKHVLPRIDPDSYQCSVPDGLLVQSAAEAAGTRSKIKLCSVCDGWHCLISCSSRGHDLWSDNHGPIFNFAFHYTHPLIASPLPLHFVCRCRKERLHQLVQGHAGSLFRLKEQREKY